MVCVVLCIRRSVAFGGLKQGPETGAGGGAHSPFTDNRYVSCNILGLRGVASRGVVALCGRPVVTLAVQCDEVGTAAVLGEGTGLSVLLGFMRSFVHVRGRRSRLRGAHWFRL